MYINLNALRDIWRLINLARDMKHNTIVFKDEKGELWELKKPNSVR